MCCAPRVNRMKAKPACVLYSGGADSTHAAYIIGQTHHPLHLVSFRHRFMRQCAKSNRNVARLRKQFGDNAVVHCWIDMDSLWRRIGRNPAYVSFPEYGAFALVLKSCLACKAAMHLLTAAYCEERKITLVVDGAHPDGAHLFPEQGPEGIAVLREFYHRHGIAYENPVYQIRRPDVELFRHGITDKKNTKEEHLYYSNQFSCHVGLIPYGYYYAVCLLTGGRKRISSHTIRFLRKCLLEEPAAVGGGGGAAFSTVEC